MTYMEWMIDEIMKCVEGIYIIEEESKKIIYVNAFIARGKEDNFVGHKCYEAFCGKKECCSICPDMEVYHQDNYSGNNCYHWDYFDKNTKKWMKIKNRLYIENGIKYRIGNINMIEDMMNLNYDAIKEMGTLYHVLNEYGKVMDTLEYQSMHDKMTYLYNRNQYIQDMEERYQGIPSAGVLYYDLNNLKEVNDKYRHSVGDLLLKRIAASILSCMNQEEMRAYRIGGDEFIVLYSSCTEEDLEALKCRIAEELDRRNRREAIPCLTAVGMAYSQSVMDIEVLVMQADRRMYEDKQRFKKQQAGESQK